MSSNMEVDGYWDEETLNHAPATKWSSLESDAVITYAQLEKAYASATWGLVEPSVIVMSPTNLAALKNQFQTHQKVVITTYNPLYGVGGLIFNSATILADKTLPDDQFALYNEGTKGWACVDILKKK